MNTVNVDQRYKEVAWKFVNHCRGHYEFSEFIRIMGFYIALIKTEKLTSNTSWDYIYEQRLELDHVNTITINDVCHTLPQEYTIRQICEFVSKLPDLVIFFETIISMTALQAGRFQGEFIQPSEVTHLVTSLIENREINYVYNPFAGIASYQMDNKSVRYYSQELNYHTWLIGKIRLLLNDVDSDSYVCEDSVEKWQRIKFDAVISTPPFGGKIDQNRYYYTNGQNYTHREYESFYIDYALNSITLNGIVASVVPLRFLFSRGSFLQHILNSGYVQKVVLLPDNVFYGTTVKGAVVILTKKPNNGVVMVDGSTFFKKEGRLNVLKNEELFKAIENSDSHCVKYVLNEEIAANDFNLNPAIYVNTVSDVIEIPDGFELKKLRDVVSVYRGEKVDSVNARFVRGKDLADGRFSFDKTFEDLQIELISQRCTLLDKDLLLVLKIGNLKPTYFHHSSDFEVCCNPNVLAFEFRDEIYPQYLVNELGKDYINKQIATRSGVGIMPSITLNNLLEVEVLIPDFKTQKAIFENDKQNNLLFKARELGLENHIDQLKSEYMAIVEDRQHDMRKHLRSLRYSNKQLKGYFTDQVGGVDSIVNLLSGQERAILTLSEMITAFANEEQFATPEKVNIDEFFTDLEINHTSEISYDVIYDIDSMALTEYGFLGNDDIIHSSPEDLLKELYSQDISYRNLYVNIAPLDLTRLVSNIIGNAEMHSFTDPDREDYELRIDLTIDKERNMFQIDFRNNGTPFPLGLTKEFYGRRGKSAGKTKNKGTGGYVVKSICEHFGGDFDMYCDPQSNMPVTVRIYLPIFRDDE